MAITTTKIGMINRALQLLGLEPINSLTENSNRARAMSVAYDSVLLAELRDNTWSFAVKRANLALDATQPAFGKRGFFPLPGDFLFLAPNESDGFNTWQRDWQIEGQSICSADNSPITIRYVSSNITESMFDPLFAEAFSASLAFNTCEQLTNSNTKKTDLERHRMSQITKAKKRNAIEQPPVYSPTCSWITVRA